MAPSFILWLSFHFLRSQNQKSHSSVFLCCETKQKRLLHRLVVLWCIIVIGKLSFITGVIFSCFLGKQRPTAQSEQGVSDTHNGGRQQWCVNRQYFFCAFPIIGVSCSKPTLCGFGSPEKRKEIMPVMQAVGKQASLSGPPVTSDCLLYVPSAIFIPTFQPKKKSLLSRQVTRIVRH